jgi:hypothetical protein
LNFIRYYVVFQEAHNRTALEQEIETITNPPKPMGIEEAILDYTRKEGELKGKKEAAFGMLAEGLSLDAIVRIVKLPLETIQIWQSE